MDPTCCSSCSPPASPPRDSKRGEFSIRGMSCANCARHVTEAIQAVPGVSSVAVSLEAQRVVVRWNAAANVEAVMEAVRRAGFQAQPLAETSPDAATPPDSCDGWRLNLWVGLLGTVPLALGEWMLHLGAERWFQWMAFALAAVVQVVAGGRFYRGAWNQIKVRRANMDALVALGSTAAFGFSTVVLFSGSGGHLYFLEAAAIITLISIGHWLEARMGLRATSSLKKLLHLAPPQARRRHADGSESVVPVAELKTDDLVALRPGDRVPVDGKVVEGESALDESMLTGEALPVDKARGATVYAGTVNLNGRLVVQVTASGETTALAHIIAAVQRAQNSRASIQRLGDQVSSVFVPVVVGIALATALWWWLAPASAQQVATAVAGLLHLPVHSLPGLAAVFVHAAAVLIVACPCAMGLATPTAIMAGTNAAAERGILVRDGIALEKAGQITSVVFDKTGTLTSGQPVVAHSATFVGGDRPKIHELKLAAALARHSSHPLSQAVAALHSEEMPLLNWEEVRGSGVQCYLHLPGPNPRLAVARLGALSWLRAAGVDLACGDEFVATWADQGATLLGVSVDKHLLGLVALADKLKPGAVEMLQDLKSGGYKIYLLTGDHAHTARAIAQQAQIPPENVFAEVRPEEKALRLQELQKRGERVAFVGDGINDAPALEQADLGIAVSRASDVALEAADIILLRPDIQCVAEGLGLARATLRTIKQNLFWAFFYNALGIPLAALGLFSPVMCALAMGMSDLIVIGNALLLRQWRHFAWHKWRRKLLRHLEE